MESKVKNKNKLVYILITAIFVVAGFLLYKNYFYTAKKFGSSHEQRTENKDDLIGFSFAPEKISTTVGKDFIMEVRIDPKKHTVSNADLIFSYDKSKMRLDSISQSEHFVQVLTSKIADDGNVSYSAATVFGLTINSQAVYATLHFHALAKADSVPIAIDQKKSGIYADDNPGVNIAGESKLALISITD